MPDRGTNGEIGRTHIHSSSGSIASTSRDPEIAFCAMVLQNQSSQHFCVVLDCHPSADWVGAQLRRVRLHGGDAARARQHRQCARQRTDHLGEVAARSDRWHRNSACSLGACTLFRAAPAPLPAVARVHRDRIHACQPRTMCGTPLATRRTCMWHGPVGAAVVGAQVWPTTVGLGVAAGTDRTVTTNPSR